MENIGDWLYIVLLIVAGISGIWKTSFGKKRERATDTSEQPDAPVIPPRAPASYPSTTMPPQRKGPRKKKPAPFFANEGERALPSSPPSPQPTEDALDETDAPAFHLPTEPFSNSEELKKAILYSEILHRKY